jgi:uncharacterized Zn-finger protein
VITKDQQGRSDWKPAQTSKALHKNLHNIRRSPSFKFDHHCQTHVLRLCMTTDQHLPKQLQKATSSSHLVCYSDSNIISGPMTMVDSRNFGGMGYDNIYSHHMQPSTHFSNPWTSHETHSTSAYPPLPKSDLTRPSAMSMSYPQMPVSAPMSSGSSYSNLGYAASDLLSGHQDISRSGYGQSYTTPSSSASYTATASAYPALDYAQSLHQQQQQQQRKASDSYVAFLSPNSYLRLTLHRTNNSRAANASFGELDASRGMLALSHSNLQDLTPRNIYDVRAQRGSTDSYGFPSASSTSSISASGRQEYPYYSGSSGASVDSATDYSSAASDAGYDSIAASRTLPRPSQLVGANLGPPAPSSMMGQFSSKMSSNTQKKHKCKVCDKRFTRPSSLQTHMYSHTGEKPFACNVEGCGRHFSVVSNLRRHRKVHKGEALSVHSDDEE